jgi:predicted aspartyl protease
MIVFVILGAGSSAAGDQADAEKPGAESEPPAEAVLAAIPFHPYPDPTRIMLDLAPEGRRPFVLMLATSTSHSVITPLMARQLRVSVRSIKDTRYRRKTRLGRDLQFWVDTQSSDTGSRTGWEYGFLGDNFLREYVLEIDYPGRVVRFLDPEIYEVPEVVSAPDESVVSLRSGSTSIEVSFEIDGHEMRGLLSTGSPETVMLSGAFAKQAGIDVESLPVLGRIQGTVGPAEVRLYETDGFRFAGFDFEPIPILVSPSGWYNQAGPTDSLIGYDILRQFVLRIDYKRQRMWLRRVGDTHTTFGGMPYPGAKALLDGMTAARSGVPSEEKAEQLREDSARRDRENAERFEREKDNRLYVEVPGGWVLVEGHRLRRGPAEGEKWVSFEEMQRIKRERAEAERETP